MSKISFSIDLSALTTSESFTEASREELRVLLALVAGGGAYPSREALAKAAGVSMTRCASALALWQESGIISAAQKRDTGTEIIDEFDEDPLKEITHEESSLVVAESIRDGNLAELIDECAGLMGRPALSTQETKQIEALYSQLALSAEYILTLAAHLASKGKLTPTNLKKRAETLASKGIDTLEELERYISEQESTSSVEWEYRHLLGIYNRNLSTTEKKYFRIWSEEYGYGVGIVGEAYDITVINTGKVSLKYMHALLTAWHGAGCKTVEECRERAEAERVRKAAEKAARTDKKKKTEAETSTPKYSSFDADDALMAALERSYGESGDGDKA